MNKKLSNIFSRIGSYFFADLSSRKGKILSMLIFILALHFFYNYIGVYKFIHARPCSIHISAQTSRACVALNYYENDMNFFTPQYQRTMEGGGYTGLEFPIIYYLGAILYKIFGFNEIYLRLISLIITSIGLLFFYFLSLQFSKSRLLSLGIIGAVIISPVFLFYTPNFMPDPPSIGLIFISWYFLFQYMKDTKTRYLNLYILFATLGVLLKISGAICFGVVIGLLILDQFRFFKNEEREMIFPNKLKIILRIAAGMLVVISWYKYTAWYPTTKGGSTFLLSANHYENWEGMLNVFSWMKKLWLYHYFSLESYIVLIAIIAVFLFTIFKAKRILVAITLFYLIGSLFYFLVFLNQFMHHDYYIITMLPTLFFMSLCVADSVSKISLSNFPACSYIVIALLFYGFYKGAPESRKNYHDRYSSDIYYWTGDYRAYEDLEPKLRKAGIIRSDRFVCGYDNSDCASLYLINQLGATFGDQNDRTSVDSLLLHRNTKYLILTDSADFRKRFNYELSDKVFLRHRGLIIYKMK